MAVSLNGQCGKRSLVNGLVPDSIKKLPDNFNASNNAKSNKVEQLKCSNNVPNATSQIQNPLITTNEKKCDNNNANFITNHNQIKNRVKNPTKKTGDNNDVQMLPAFSEASTGNIQSKFINKNSLDLKLIEEDNIVAKMDNKKIKKNIHDNNINHQLDKNVKANKSTTKKNNARSNVLVTKSESDMNNKRKNKTKDNTKNKRLKRSTTPKINCKDKKVVNGDNKEHQTFSSLANQSETSKKNDNDNDIPSKHPMRTRNKKNSIVKLKADTETNNEKRPALISLVNKPNTINNRIKNIPFTTNTKIDIIGEIIENMNKSENSYSTKKNLTNQFEIKHHEKVNPLAKTQTMFQYNLNNQINQINHQHSIPLVRKPEYAGNTMHSMYNIPNRALNSFSKETIVKPRFGNENLKTSTMATATKPNRPKPFFDSEKAYFYDEILTPLDEKFQELRNEIEENPIVDDDNDPLHLDLNWIINEFEREFQKAFSELQNII